MGVRRVWSCYRMKVGQGYEADNYQFQPLKRAVCPPEPDYRDQRHQESYHCPLFVG